MKHLFAVAIILCASICYGQGIRWDLGGGPGGTGAVSVSGAGGQVFVQPGVSLNWCNYPANAVPCTNFATTYTSQTLATPCATNTPIVQQGSTSCQSTGDNYGNLGVWTSINTSCGGITCYAYTLTVNGSSSGPFFWSPGAMVLLPSDVVLKAPSATQTITGQPLNLNNVLFTLTGTSEMDGPIGVTTPNTGVFTSVGVGTSSPVTLTKSATPPTTGFLDVNTGLHLNSSLVVDTGAIQNNADESYISLKDGGHLIAVQAGPRAKESTITSTSITSNVLTVTGVQLEAFVATDVVYISGTKESFLNGQTCTVATSNGTTQFTCPFTHANYTNASDTGEAVTGFLLADSTLTLPDMAGGTSTPNSGFLLGSTVATLVSSPGHCMFFDSSKGVVNDSGFTCNSNIGFPVNTRSIQWVNGGNSISLTSAASSGSRTATLPDATGNVLLSSTAEIITTCAVITVTAAQNGWCSFFNTVPITVTRVLVSAQTAAVGCSTSPQFGVRGTAATVALANGNGVQDSGAMSVNIAAGAQQTIGVANVDAGCSTQPANVMVTVQYHMQ